MKEHINVVHEGLKLHKCEICDKDFGYRAHLAQHLKTCAVKKDDPEILEKKYKCERCEKSFDTKEYLKDHRIAVHIKPHKCDKCDKAYGTPRDLKGTIL